MSINLWLLDLLDSKKTKFFFVDYRRVFFLDCPRRGNAYSLGRAPEEPMDQLEAFKAEAERARKHLLIGVLNYSFDHLATVCVPQGGNCPYSKGCSWEDPRAAGSC